MGLPESGGPDAGPMGRGAPVREQLLVRLDKNKSPPHSLTHFRIPSREKGTYYIILHTYMYMFGFFSRLFIIFLDVLIW